MINLIKFGKNDFGFLIFYGESFIRLLMFIFISSLGIFILGMSGIWIVVGSSILLIKLEDDYLDQYLIKSLKKEKIVNLKGHDSKVIYEIFTYTYGLDDNTNDEIISQWNFILSSLSFPITVAVKKDYLNIDPFLKENPIYNSLFASNNSLMDHYFLIINKSDSLQLESLLEKVSISYIRLEEDEVKIFEDTEEASSA